MPLYESVFIARQDISAAQVETLATTFAGIVTAEGGAVAKQEYWGLRNLAFKIRKNRKGHYVLFNLDAPAPAVLEMERNMRINEDVIRFMTVRVDELEEGPSAVLSNRGERSERGERGERGDRGDRYERGPRRRDDDDRGRGADDQVGE